MPELDQDQSIPSLTGVKNFKQKTWFRWAPLTPQAPWSLPGNPSMTSVMQALSKYNVRVHIDILKGAPWST